MRNLRFKLHVRKELSYHQYQKKKKEIVLIGVTQISMG